MKGLRIYKTSQYYFVNGDMTAQFAPVKVIEHKVIMQPVVGDASVP